MQENLIHEELKNLETEKRNVSTNNIDVASSLEIAQLINNEDHKCAEAVSSQLTEIAKAIDLITYKLKNGGKLFYVGAGTSGRLGVLDASECPPTFGTDPEMVQGVIAGGYDTLVMSKEGIEDEVDTSWKDLVSRGVSSKDVICGIMASGRTPYVVSAIEKARENNISTILVACNKHVKINADINILPVAGAEVITGSTRMKSGTMQKMVLNMLTTGTMIRMGKVYKNTMIDLKMTSKKLEERAKNMLMEFCDLSYLESEQLLFSAHGHVKSAIAMHFTGKSFNEVQIEINKQDGFLRPVIEVNNS